MKKSRRMRKCRICGRLFYPDRYNHHHQQCCSRSECQRERKRLSSKKYHRRKRNDPNFRKAEVEQVKTWRKNNPNYRKKLLKRKKSQKKSKNDDVLRDSARGKNDYQNEVLRDVTLFQMHCLQGLICNLNGVLRDDIGSLMNHYYDRGKALFPELEKQLNQGVFPYDQQNCCRSGAP